MGNDLNSEELLHLVTTPPEIYIAEGGMVTAAGQTFFESRHEETLNIVNNVLNRILISAKGELTYQDRTYITDVLYKLGIRDDKKFMSQVRRYIDQSRDEQRFLRLYNIEGPQIENENIRNELNSLRQEVLAGRDETEPYRNELYLSNIIMNRLQTAEIYQTVASFSGDTYDTSLSSSEYAVTEQSISSQKLLRELMSERLSEYEHELVYRNEAGTVEEVSEEEPKPFRAEGERELPGIQTVREIRTEEGVRETRAETVYRTDQRTERELVSELENRIIREPFEAGEVPSEGAGEQRPDAVITAESRTEAPPQADEVYAASERIYTNELLRELSERQIENERILQSESRTDLRTQYRETELILREEQAGTAGEPSEETSAQVLPRGAEEGREELLQGETVREIRTEEGVRESYRETVPGTDQRTERELRTELENNIIRELRNEGEIPAQRQQDQRPEAPSAPASGDRAPSQEEQTVTPAERIYTSEVLRELSERQTESERLLQSESRTDQRTEYRETELIHRIEQAGGEGEAEAEALNEQTGQIREAPGEEPSVRDAVREVLTEEGIRDSRSEIRTLLDQRTERELERELENNIVRELRESGAVVTESPREQRTEAPLVYAQRGEGPSEEGETLVSPGINVTNEVLRELSERQIESERLLQREARTDRRTEYRETELIHRTEQAATEPEAGSGESPVVMPAGRSYQYISNNIYERELSSGDLHNSTVTEEINSAVFLDIVKNLYHSEIDNINRRSSSEISFRNALYNASENTFVRLNRMAGEEAVYNEFITESIPEGTAPVSLSYYSETEMIPESFPEAAAPEQAVSLEQQLIELNERNLQNVERYDQMMQLFKSLNAPERAEGGGPDRTRREALAAITGDLQLTQLIAQEESEGEERREQIIHEIEKLIPGDMVQVLQMAQQASQGEPVVPGEARVLRSNLEEAAREIQRFQERQSTPPPPEQTVKEYEGSQLIHRRNETFTAEELEELLNTVNRTRDRAVNINDQTVHTLDHRSEVRNIHTETLDRTTREQQDEIAALVARGVRAQVGAISEQVLNKLEKRLRNEKSRRGI